MSQSKSLDSLNEISFIIADKAHKKSIKQFYKQQHYSASFMGDDFCVLALSQEKIIAAALCSGIIVNAKQYFLHGVVVDEHYQHRGIASKLINQCWQHLINLAQQKQANASLVCFAESDLLPLYQTNGFKVVCTDTIDNHLKSRYLIYSKKHKQLKILHRCN